MDFRHRNLKQAVKIEIRTDVEAGLIRAAFVADGAERIEFSTLSLSMAQSFAGAFEVWSEAVEKMMRVAVESTGVKVVRVDHVKPGDLN